MLSGISLIALLTLLALMNCASGAMDDSPAATTIAHQQEEWTLASGTKTPGREDDDVASDVSTVTDVAEDDDKDELVFSDVQDVHDAQSKTEVQERGNRNSDLLVAANAK